MPWTAASAALATSSSTRAPSLAATTPGCPANLADELAVTDGSGELLTVEASRYATSSATFTAWRRTGGCYRRVAGPWIATVGVSGLSDHHVEGDGSTPTGAFDIGPTMYGVAPDPGVTYPYHQLTCGDWWDEDPTSPEYNSFEHVACGTRPPFGGASEALWTEVPAYEHFAVIGYNSHPVVAGRGSGIFLHVSTGAPTVGCVALPEAQLDLVLRWLRRGLHPLVVIGTDAEIRRF